MKLWVAVLAVALVGCGGGGTNPEPVPGFTYPVLENGFYTGGSSGTGFNVPAYNATLEVSDTQVKFTVEGYPAIVGSKEWSQKVTFEGEDAWLVIDPSEKNPGGYQVALNRDGLGWFTRTYTNWRTWEVK